MGEGHSHRCQMPESLPGGVPDIFQLFRGRVDIAQDHERHRETQQGIQAQNQTDGDFGGRAVLLHSPRIHFAEDGTALAGKPHRKSAEKPALLESDGWVGAISHKTFATTKEVDNQH